MQLLEEQLAEAQSKLAAEVENTANAAKAQRQELLQLEASLESKVFILVFVTPGNQVHCSLAFKVRPGDALPHNSDASSWWWSNRGGKASLLQSP